MSITEIPQEIKLYNRVFDLMYDAERYLLGHRYQKAYNAVKRLQFVIEGFHVQQYIYNFEEYAEKEGIELPLPIDYSKIDVQISSLSEN